MQSIIPNEQIPIHEEPWGTLQWLVSGSAKTSETMTVGRVTIKAGMKNPNHVHPNCSEILYLVSGKLEHTLPDGSYAPMKPGDSIVIEQGVWHHACSVGEEDAVVLVMFDSAKRETIGE